MTAQRRQKSKKQKQSKQRPIVRETKADLESLEQSHRELEALIQDAEYWIARGQYQLDSIDAKILVLKNARAEVEFKIDRAPERLAQLRQELVKLEDRMKKTAVRPQVDKLASAMAEAQRLAEEMGVTPEQLQAMLAAGGGAS